MADLVIRGGTLVTPEGIRASRYRHRRRRIAAIAPELPARPRRDRCARPDDPAGPDRRPRTLQRARPHGMGRRGHRQPGTGGGRRHAVLRYAAELLAVHRGRVAEFDAKRAALERASVTDFALLGRHRSRQSRAAGGAGANAASIGFKAFMRDSGLPEFPRADDLTLYEGMREAARLGLPVAVHAESEEMRELTGRARERAAAASATIWIRGR